MGFVKPGPTSRYESQRRTAALTLLHIQNPDSGWGLSKKGASSIVNTAEALNVVKAAGMANADGARNGARYIPQALELHYGKLTNQVSSIRGGNVRYLTFGLEGLVTIPEVGFDADGSRGIEFCLRFIEAAQDTNGGVLADIDESLPSYHQTARAVISLSKLMLTDGAKGALSETAWESAEGILHRAVEFLVAGQDTKTGAWRDRPTRSAAFDPAKTAIATTALSYYRMVHDSADLTSRLDASSNWLLSTSSAWLKAVSGDPQESGSDWQHLNYAECARAVASAKLDADKLLESSWNFMLGCWREARNDTEISLWREPKSNVTIRAAYHTVMAFETVLQRSTLIVPRPIGAVLAEVLRLESLGDGSYSISIGSRSWNITLRNAPARDALLQELLAVSEGVSLSELARRMEKSPDVVSEYRSRLNASVREQTLGKIPEIIETVNRSLYRITPRQGVS
jgi:hypothetical protein